MKTLVELNGKYYVVSTLQSMYETVVFPANDAGEITETLELFGRNWRSLKGTVIGHEKVVEKLKEGKLKLNR